MIKISVITSLFNCTKYLVGYFEAVEKIVNKEECEFLLLHNAPKEDELAIINKEIVDKPWFRHITIEEREGLYTTWNRGIKLSQGEYCAVWNVDDIREPDSLLLQKLALDSNPDSAISFGDIWGTDVYGKYKQRFYQHPTWEENKNAYMYRHMIGCFPLWRKNIHDKIQYFEEQFKLVSDLDFQIRVARIATIEKVNKPNGYYLDFSDHKLSSSVRLQTIERNVLNLRYANFDLLNLMYIYPAIKQYSTFRIKNQSKSFHIKTVFPNFWFYWILRIPKIFVAFIKFPKDLARVLYHKFF